MKRGSSDPRFEPHQLLQSAHRRRSIRPRPTARIMPRMQVHRPIVTAHRVQRIILWALTLLYWIAATLPSNRHVSRRHIEQRGDISRVWLTRLVANIVLIRAARIAHV